MSLFQVLMIAGVIPAVVTWLLHFLSEKGLEEEGSVYMPKGFLLAGLFCGLLCIVLTVCSALLKLGITWQVLQISSAVLTLVCYILDHAEKYPRIAVLLVKKEDLNI